MCMPNGTWQPNESDQKVDFKPGQEKPRVILEGNGFMVVYKPPHWTMTTTVKMPRSFAIQAWLCDSFGHRYPFLRENPLQAGLVQRLDVETSGPVVVATNCKSFEHIWNLRKQGCFYREYCALLHGKLPLKHACGTLDYNLELNHCWTKVSERFGIPARTCYQAIASYTRRIHGAERWYTLIRVRILTGRTHQIRVHMRALALELNFPVCGLVGDYRYLPRKYCWTDWDFCPRIFLHAQELRFPNPDDLGATCQVKCELPEDLAQVLDALRVDDDMTAEYQRLPEYLQIQSAEWENTRIVVMNRTDASRSPSRWRAEDDEDMDDEAADGGLPSEVRLLPPGSRSRSRSKSSAPSRWCPSPSPSSSGTCLDSSPSASPEFKLSEVDQKVSRTTPELKCEESDREASGTISPELMFLTPALPQLLEHLAANGLEEPTAEAAETFPEPGRRSPSPTHTPTRSLSPELLKPEVILLTPVKTELPDTQDVARAQSLMQALPVQVFGEQDKVGKFSIKLENETNGHESASFDKQSTSKIKKEKRKKKRHKSADNTVVVSKVRRKEAAQSTLERLDSLTVITRVPAEAKIKKSSHKAQADAIVDR